MARPRQVSDAQILDVVRACVWQWGPQVSLERIAERLGVTQPALLKRFGTKQALLVAALVPSEKMAWVKALEAGPDDRALREQVHELLTSVSEHMERVVPRMSALRESGIPFEELLRASKNPPPVVALRAVTAWLERAQARGLVDRALHAESTAAAMLGAVNARIHLSHLLKRPWTRRSSAEYLSDVAGLFAQALEARAPSAPGRGRRA